MTNEPGTPDQPRDPEAIPVVRRAEPVSSPPMVLRVPEDYQYEVVEAVPREPRKPQPGFWLSVALTLAHVGVLYGALLAAFVVALMGYGAAQGFNALKPAPLKKGEEMKISSLPEPILASLALSIPVGYSAGLLFAVLMARVFQGRGWSRLMGLRRLPAAHLLLAAVALPGFILFSNVVGELLFKLMRFEPPEHGLDAMFGSFHWSFAVLAIGIGPGVVEEFWCRGFLGRGLLARFGWPAGIALASMFFGLMHVWPPPYVMTTAVMGVGLHLVYVFSRSLWVSMFVHFANNSLSVLGAMKVINLAAVEAKADQSFELVALLAGGNLLFGLLAMWSARGRLVWAHGGPVSPPDPGMIVPPEETLIRIVHHAPNPVWVSFSIVFFGALIYLLFLR